MKAFFFHAYLCGPESVVSLLRIPDSYHAKTLKIHTPLVRFALYFHYQAVFQKFERSFFDQVAIDAKNASTFENRPLVAELKLKI